VEVSSDSTVPADGAALCAYQYFENVRNFVIGLQDLGLPTFEASDLEKVTILFNLFILTMTDQFL
jgi:kinesin family protein C2/C3